MNYTKMLYKSIGNRIKLKRSSTTVTVENKIVPATLDNLRDMDNASLSRIQNGIALKRKNPYLMNYYQAEYLCEKLGIKMNELIWGKTEEQENFVKIILLAIMINGASYHDKIFNPFCYFESTEELFEWAYKQSIIPGNLKQCILYALEVHKVGIAKDDYEIQIDDNSTITLKELKIQIEEICHSKYGFYYSKQNYDFFELLKSEHDESLEALSDILFNQLMHDYKFSSSFTERVSNRIFNQDYDITPRIFDLEQVPILDNADSLLLHPSRFILEAIDYRNEYYASFIYAFNSLWQRSKNAYMDYFNKSIFQNPIINKISLKAFQDKDFDRIIKSDTFYDLCNITSVIDEYINPESILSKNYFRLMIQATIQKNAIVNLPNYDSTLWEHLSNSVIQTKEFANKILKTE